MGTWASVCSQQSTAAASLLSHAGLGVVCPPSCLYLSSVYCGPRSGPRYLASSSTRQGQLATKAISAARAWAYTLATTWTQGHQGLPELLTAEPVGEPASPLSGSE